MIAATDKFARMPDARLLARMFTTIGIVAHCRFSRKKSRNNLAASISRTPPMTSGR
jgi:hypothetical protein